MPRTNAQSGGRRRLCITDPLHDTAREVLARCTAEGTILEVGGAFEAFFGFPPDGLVGRSWFDFVEPDVVARFAAWLAQDAPKGIDLITTNQVVLDGAEPKTLVWTNHAILDAAGRVVEIRSIGTCPQRAIELYGAVLRGDQFEQSRELRRHAAEEPAAGSLAQLTQRQRELAMLLANAFRLPDAALSMGISYHTARNHLRAIFDKLGVSTQAELIALIRREAPAAAASGPRR